MPEPRDPRVDPMPGDKLRKGKTVRTVGEQIFVHSSEVRFFVGNTVCWHSRESWRKWAKNAEVLHIA